MKKTIVKIVIGLLFAAPVLYIVINNAIVNKKNQEYWAKIDKLESKYTVVSKDKYPRMSKISYVVRLHKKCTEREIKQIAYHLKEKYPYQDKVFIEYYLEGMDITGVAWATSHFIYNELTIKK